VQMRQNALPILENFGVDLVLAGHSHSYERSFLIDGHYADSSTFSAAMVRDAGSGRPSGSGAYDKPSYSMSPHEGGVYVVAGTSGKTGGGTLNHPAMFLSQSLLGSVVLDVQGRRLDALFLDSAGIARDSFSIVKGTGGSTATTRPYGGIPAPIPGTVQAENFDEGPAGLAYYDTTPGNQSGAYRQTDVDIEGTTDGGPGHNLARTRSREWLQYTVDVAATGTYTFETRVAVVGSGARFHLEVDGVDRTGSLAIPDTGGWQAWRTIVGPAVALTSGQRRIRIVFDTASAGGGVGNYNWFRFTASPPTAPPPATTPYGGVAVSVPGRVQAENFDDGGQTLAYYDASTGNSGSPYRTSDVDIGTTGDPNNGGYYVGWTRVGEWLKYTVDVSQGGTYRLNVRVANAGSGAQFQMDVDGIDRTGAIDLPNTGGWDRWQTVSIPGVVLMQGRREIKLLMVDRNAENSGVGNFGYLEFQLTAAATP